MREMRQREIDVAAVGDMKAEEVSLIASLMYTCHK